MKLLSSTNIGRLRRFLLISKPCKWNAWVRDLTAYLGMILLLVSTGCSAQWWANAYPPVTMVKVSKGLLGLNISVKNTKDVDVELGKVTFNLKTGDGEIEFLKFHDRASPVLDAQTRQQEALAKTMAVQVEYQRAIGNNIAMAIAAGGEAAANFIGKLPNVSGGVTFPGGGANIAIERQPSNEGDSE